MKNQKNSVNKEDNEDFLNIPSVKEDWGGDGRGRMNLSGRYTAISKEYTSRQYQFFDTNAVQEENGWRISGMPENIAPGSRRLLTWHDCGASTSKLVLPTHFEAPSGFFTADLEIFILSGAIQIGEWQLNKHAYSFIPAGVKVGDWKVLGGEAAEILWMENGFLKYQNASNNHPEARLHEFIPALDSKLLAWGKTDTVQFVQATKKWLRKDSNGGGVWLLAILPHYDGQQQMIQAYNEEAYGLFGHVEIGNYSFGKNHFGYSPTLSTLPKHISDDGGLFFVRIDRDLSKLGTVFSYTHTEE